MSSSPAPRVFARAADVLRAEAEAVLAVAERLDDAAVDRAVELLAGCVGKVVLTGAGTSGNVARKAAATLTSTGTPAVFLHPADALHGDLGLVDERDVVVAVSNSGETAEVLGALPYLRKRRVPVIVVVGRLESTLAREADVALDAGVDREACPFDLTPTSSVAAALGVLDALAVLVLQRRGLTPEQFARNHPSGRLGRRLTLTVRDLMHGGEALPQVTADDGWLEVVSAISTGGLGAAVVVDADGHLDGIVTDGDVRRALATLGATGLTGATARELRTASPVSVAPQLLAYDAVSVMEDRPSQIAHLPVVDDDGRCVGLLRLHDIVRAGLS